MNLCVLATNTMMKNRKQGKLSACLIIFSKNKQLPFSLVYAKMKVVMSLGENKVYDKQDRSQGKKQPENPEHF